jgi:hypothetical protein
LAQDVLYNALLCRANEDLCALPVTLRQPTGGIDNWLSQMRLNFNTRSGMKPLVFLGLRSRVWHADPRQYCFNLPAFVWWCAYEEASTAFDPRALA